MRILFVLIAFLTISNAVHAASIRENFLSLRKIFNPQGRTVDAATVSTRSNEAYQMVGEYLKKRYDGVPNNYRYFWNSDRLMVNDASAGTIKPQYVDRVVNEWVHQKFRWSPETRTI